MYIHRTASDFLAEDQTWNQILEQPGTTSNINFGVHRALFRGFTLQLKACSSGTATTTDGFEMLLATPLSLAYFAGSEKDLPSVEIIDASLMILSSLRQDSRIFQDMIIPIRRKIGLKIPLYSLSEYHCSLISQQNSPYQAKYQYHDHRVELLSIPCPR